MRLFGLSGLVVGSLGLSSVVNEAREQAVPAPVPDNHGSLNIRVRGARADLPLTIHIDSPRRDGSEVLAPNADPILTRGGLPFGSYFVSATQGHDFVTPIVTVVVDRAHPAASVELELRENHSTLVLIEPDDWKPVLHGTIKPVRLGGPPFLRSSSDVGQVQPGVYSLVGLRPGTPLLIYAEGFVPVCRLVPSNDTDVVLLERGRRVSVQFPRDMTPAAMAELATLDEVPGSDCPLPLSIFRPRAVTATSDDATYRIDHFHQGYRFLLRRPGLSRHIVVPDDGPVIVEQP